MTLQTKALRWSMGIHLLFFLGLFLLSAKISEPSRPTVIDFSLVEMPAAAAGPLKGPPTHSGNSSSGAERLAAKSRPLHKKAAPEKTAPEIQKPRPKKAEAPTKKTSPPVPRPPSKPVSRPQPAPMPHASAQPPSTPLPEPFLQTAPGTAFLPETGQPRRRASTGRTPGVAGSGASGRSDRSGLGGGGKALGSGSKTLSTKESFLKEHFSQIRDLIQKNLSYPGIARKKGWSGQVKISFILCKDGSVDSIKILKSSGFSLLDKNAGDTVKKVSPFPLPPVKAEIIVPITYSLK